MPHPDEPSALAYTARRVRRHLRWARTEGVRRLIEEDRLDPVDRARTALAKWRWRRAHPGPPGRAVPVYLVGLQRSGTNMLTRGLDADPSVEVRNENDRAVFHRFRLRPDPVLGAVIRRSRHRYVLVKPLCDTHRVDELLGLAGVAPGRALWAYRDVDDRARSEVAKFGDANLRALRAIADGTIGDRWQGQRLDAPMRDLVAGFDYDRMTPHTAAALFWYVRNSLYFSLGLADRPDTLLCSYDLLVADPDARALILQFLARHVDQVERIRLRIAADELPELWLTDLAVHVEAQVARPGSSAPMARLLALDALAGLPAGPGRVRVELTGDRWLAGTHLLDGATGRLELSGDATGSVPAATLTAAGLSALAYGVLDPAEVDVRGLGRVPADAAAELRRLFPRRWPYLFADF
ncbi:hypothetical protein QLR68_02360 [Micromonospora sp. DH15]|nr:hypothetical protein [Micromonospora sp. DH15]